MLSPVSALALTPAEIYSRAHSDLRMGLPCLMTHDKTQAVVVALEPLTPERFEALRTLFGTPELVITTHRARAVIRPCGAPDLTSEVVRIRPPQATDLSWFREIADCTSDLVAPARVPLHVIRDGDMMLPTFALKMVKSATLLPAAIVFPLQPGGALPPEFDVSRIDVAQIAGHIAELPAFLPVASAVFPLQDAGAGRLHVFRDPTGTREHYALEIGAPDRALPVLTRLHSACFTGDVLGSLKCDCGPQLKAALAQMGDEGAGLLIYLNQEGRGIGLANKMRVYDLQAQGFDTVEANHRLGFEDDERDFRVAAVMLRSLGFTAARLLTNNPAKVKVFRAQGIAITEQLPLRVGKNVHNSGYLATKALKSGHAL